MIMMMFDDNNVAATYDVDVTFNDDDSDDDDSDDVYNVFY